MESAGQQELRQAFALFDENKDGYVSVKEVARLVEAVGGSMTETEAAAVIKTASKEKRAWVDFEDFRAIWSAIQGMEEEEQEIRSEFQRFDQDSNGFISKEEMVRVLEASGGFVRDKMEEAYRCIAELDINKDGFVSYPEFLLV